MNNDQYVIGVDYGTDSVRSIIVNAANGKEVAAAVFPYPRWKYKWDVDADMAVQSRLKCFDMAATEKLTLLGFHFPFPGLGGIYREGQGFRYVPRHMSLV